MQFTIAALIVALVASVMAAPFEFDDLPVRCSTSANCDQGQTCQTSSTGLGYCVRK
ncbi:hypothetical protein QVD99_000344 [Batrachochytrium dendrobatidis]|nr:hypothetical protein O5D80_007920 [Batrachochytrium dendrobatidis]KAK5672854.1 hypothetical protein QVD99_000344 [Batrachochytrium dendrobatidis]